MKLLCMIPKLSYTGAPKIMAWIANKMREFGYEVMVVTMYKSNCEQVLNEEIKYLNINYNQSNNWLYRNTIGMVKIISKYRKIVKEYKPDVILSFLDSISYFYIYLNKLLWHDKIVGSERVDPYSRHGIRAKICFDIMEKCDYLIFQTEEAKHFFGDKYNNKSIVIPNPVVLNHSMKKAIKYIDSLKVSKTPKIPIISTVGRLSIEQKRQDVLIKTAIELKKRKLDFKIMIYGDGKDKKIINQSIIENKLQNNMYLMGQQDNILEKISESTCFVLTSDYEGIPNALIEAMSIGLPCISTDCSPGGAKILIKNGNNGFLVEKGNYREIAQKIEWIIKNNDKAIEMGKRARKISEKFSENVIAKKWDEAFKSVNSRI